MRQGVWGSLVILGVGLAVAGDVGALARAQDKAAAALLAEAIAAHGGPGKLSLALTMTVESSGVLFGPSGELPTSRKMTLDLPERMRWDVESGGMKFTVIMNGAQGARGPANDLAEITPSEVDDLRDYANALQACALVPLTEGFTLTPQPERRIGEQVVLCVKARKRAREYLLFFDKQTKLFQGMAYKGREGGQLVDREIVWKELKDYDGVKLPSVITEYVAGRKIAEWRQNQYDLTKPDPKAFKLP
jgi:hypothetical protein